MNEPLAQRLRPTCLQDVVGQHHLLGPERPLSRMVEQRILSSLIFWGPPGSGKTTLAQILAQSLGLPFVKLSAIFSGVSQLRAVFEEAEKRFRLGTPTLLFVDEIHRFNKAQQDSFLPHVEAGTIVLIGATTENPSFELNNALLSRCQVFVLEPLSVEDLSLLCDRAESYLECNLPLTPAAKEHLLHMAHGDGRALLNRVEWIAQEKVEGLWEVVDLNRHLAQKAPLFDKSGDGHFNLISALHKSLRGSDPDAALYWFARMIEGGEDPLYIGRRLIRFASEDIGMADPQGLVQALSGVQAYERLGSPEGELALVQVVIYLATAPKSNALYKAYGKVQQAARRTSSLMPPKIILNAPTQLMKDQAYGKDYIYDHDTQEGFSGQDYFPDQMKRETFYQPLPRGFERDIQKRLAYWEKLRQDKRG